MTIILQHQFWALKVKDDHFEVALTFRKLPATLRHPVRALTAFFDPGVQFGLQFKQRRRGQTGPRSPSWCRWRRPRVTRPAESALPADKTPAGEVVSLDSFRKK